MVVAIVSIEQWPNLCDMPILLLYSSLCLRIRGELGVDEVPTNSWLVNVSYVLMS